jgi:TolB protein
VGGGGRIATTDPLWYGQILLIDTDGTHSGRLNSSWWHKPDVPGYAMQPTWSPDGSKIAFAGFLNYPPMTPVQTTRQIGTSEIFVVNADGTGLVRLTSNNVNDEGPAWSPDGTRIAFASDYQIFVMNAEGTGLKRLTHDNAFDIEPAWSPDGTKIAFSTDRGRGKNSVIFSMNADGTGVTQLTKDPGYDIQPAWSPDGTKIAFASERKVGYGIYLMNPDGSEQTSITGPDGYLHPSWSPDGKMIAYAEYDGGMFCLMRSDGSETTCHFGADNWVSWSRH